ncbi:MAG: hypothetical protein NTY10_03335 [Candidatus Omnitrophica bacterium]|nr:hypothetical protein [Candidatus Omnitrophota bacterium]
MTDLFADDCIEIFLDPSGKGVTYYQFALSATNAQWDMRFIESGNTATASYSALWDSAIYKGVDFWTAEVRIPLSVFYYTDSKAFSDTWLVNVARERKPEYELTTWSPLRGGFHEPDKFTKVAGMPRKDPRFDLRITNLQVYITSAEKNFTGSMEVNTSSTKLTAGEYLFSLYDAAGTALVPNQKVKVAEGEGTFTIDNLSFVDTGKRTIKATLASEKGELINGIYFPLTVNYNPLVIDITEPFYANCIFPGQEVKKITGSLTLNLPLEKLRGADLTISLGNQPPVKKKVADHVVNFTFDAASLADGEYPLTCQITTGGKMVAEHTVLIRKLAPAPGSCVYIDQNLRLIVNSKPIFARGWCGDETWMVSEELLKTTPHPDSKFVNVWFRQVSMEAERIDTSEQATGRVTKDVEPSALVFSEMQKNIEANRNNSKFLWYYLADEPECRGLSPVYLKYQYDFIKKLDPYHPVLIISRSPELYTGCADILSPHPYLDPIVDSSGKRSMRSPKEVRNQMRMVLSAGKGRIPAWHTPQAFSYGFIDKYADYPTFDEYSCMVYTGIVNGCTGIVTYCYNDHFDSIDLRLGCDFVYETLAGMDEFLLSPEKSLLLKVTTVEDGVDVMIKKVNGKVLVIAVNLLDKKTTATIECDGLKGIEKLYGYRDKTTADIQNGKITLSFNPYETRILSNPLMGADLKTAENLRKEIAVGKAALKKPGNILYGRGKEIIWDASDTYIPSKSLHSLTNGMCDTLGWRNHMARVTPVRLEAAFPAFIPKFKKINIYTGNVEELEFYIWKYGEWQKKGEIKDNHASLVTFTFPEQLSTVKIKILMPKSPPDKRAEIYEIEMYE